MNDGVVDRMSLSWLVVELTYDEFKPLLHYMYTGEIPVVDIAHLQASGVNITTLLYVINKYLHAFWTLPQRVQIVSVHDHSAFTHISYLTSVSSNAFST